MQKITVYSVPGCVKCRNLAANIRLFGLEPKVVDCTMLSNEEIEKLKLTGVPSLQIDENPPIYAGDLPLSKLKEILTP